MPPEAAEHLDRRHSRWSSRLAKLALAVGIFALAGPPIGGIVAWLMMGAGNLRSPVPFLIGAYGEAAVLAIAVGLLVALASLAGRTSALVPLAGALLINVLMFAISGSLSFTAFDPETLLRVAYVFVPPSLVAAMVCWLATHGNCSSPERPARIAVVVGTPRLLPYTRMQFLQAGQNPMKWDFPYPSRRMPVLARNCVATTQPLAAQAGISMLQNGGNAVDAAVATAIALTVVEPCNNGLGSDAFAIVWDGKKLHGLNASGRSPAGWTPDRFSGPAMPHEGWNSATIPGAIAAWAELNRKFGRLPLADLFEPAIRYASDGFLVSPTVATIWGNQVERLHAQPGFAETFLPHGRAPNAAEQFRPPYHADTLKKLAKSGGESIYRGELAETVARASKADGGFITTDDLAAHRCDWIDPIDVEFRGHRVHELPPNGQGIAALIALGILDRLDIESLPPDSAEMLHLQIEALKLGAADVRAHVADPDAMTVTVSELLDPTRLDDFAKILRRDEVVIPAPRSMNRGATVYLATADQDGMMVSLIQSNYHGFGSGVVVPGTGIALNNRGSCFVTKRGHPNRVGPKKRPLNTIIPGFITKDGAPFASFGVMGGTMQPQGHTQVVSRMLASGQNPQAAIDAPRWRVEGDEVWVETTIPPDARRGLATRGHSLRDGTLLEFGAAQIIQRVAHGYIAGSEGRRDGCSIGF